jgi:enoyl-CoA hydratase/carnithine racemase
LACDMIVAASSAKFGLVEATLGLHPLMGWNTASRTTCWGGAR